MLKRSDDLGHSDPHHYVWCASQHHKFEPTNAHADGRAAEEGERLTAPATSAPRFTVGQYPWPSGSRTNASKSSNACWATPSSPRSRHGRSTGVMSDQTASEGASNRTVNTEIGALRPARDVKSEGRASDQGRAEPRQLITPRGPVARPSRWARALRTLASRLATVNGLARKSTPLRALSVCAASWA